MTHIRVLTPSGPKYTDPATLTHFSRSQTHFWPKNRKLKIHITLSFMIGFWWNFVWMDPHRTPSCWPTFRWPWPTSSGQTRNRRVCTKQGVLGGGRFNGAIQILPGPTLVAMVTKIGLFSTLIGHNFFVQMLEPPSLHQTGSFWGRPI